MADDPHEAFKAEAARKQAAYARERRAWAAYISELYARFTHVGAK